MERTWTDIGKQDLASIAPDDSDEIQRALVERSIENLTWESVEGAKPMLPGLGIKECIKQLRLPKVSQVAISHDLAPYGFYGIEARYKNGRARVYVLDRGTDLIPLASDFWPNEEQPGEPERPL